MQLIDTPQLPRTPRRDGWTLARRERFLEHLAAGLDVKRACARSDTPERGAMASANIGTIRGWRIGALWKRRDRMYVINLSLVRAAGCAGPVGTVSFASP